MLGKTHLDLGTAHTGVHNGDYVARKKALFNINKQNMKEKVFDYNGSVITFQTGDGNVMINATEMAKPFGKSSNHERMMGMRYYSTSGELDIK